MSRTLNSLKELARSFTGASAGECVGDTIDEVIDYIKNNFSVVLTDADGAKYDLTVSTTGVLSATARVKVATPTFAPASDTTFAETQAVAIACATSGATIYYTTDGTAPTKESTVYTGAITLSETTTIKAFADKANCTNSAVATATYTKQ